MVSALHVRGDMTSRAALLMALFGASAGIAACGTSEGESALVQREAITSDAVRIVDFEFEGAVLAGDSVAARGAVVRQLLYAQGILRTRSDASGHIGNVRLSDLTETPDGDKTSIAYRAQLPVAWSKDAPLPVEGYELILPLDTTTLDAFDQKYDGSCGRSEHGRENFWHDWNPWAEGCSPAEDDVTRLGATVTTHRKPKRKYPEYDRIWEDDRLDVVAIFGVTDKPRNEKWGTAQSWRFIDLSTSHLRDVQLVWNDSTPSLLADVTIFGTAILGRQPREVRIDVLVVDAIADVGPDFDERYDPLSANADLIFYNGHARLGENLHAFARKGKVTRGKYQLVLVNSCESFALMDTTMTDRRRQVNGRRDPHGTRFLDVMGNARPGYANNLASVSNEILLATLNASIPLDYSSLLARMPESHAAAVYGEEDNAFDPDSWPISRHRRPMSEDQAARMSDGEL